VRLGICAASSAQPLREIGMIIKLHDVERSLSMARLRWYFASRLCINCEVFHRSWVLPRAEGCVLPWSQAFQSINSLIPSAFWEKFFQPLFRSQGFVPKPGYRLSNDPEKKSNNRARQMSRFRVPKWTGDLPFRIRVQSLRF